MWNEFKEFVNRGNVLDLAVGVVIGAAFGKIVASFVGDILMPLFGLMLGKVDFANLFISLDGQVYSTLAQAQQAGAPTLNYGLFLNSLLDFLIIALAIFLLVRQVNRWRNKQEAAAPAVTKACPFCLSEIPLAASRCPACTSELSLEG